MPLITKPKNPFMNGVIAIGVGMLVLVIIFYGLKAAVQWVGPVPIEEQTRSENGNPQKARSQDDVKRIVLEGYPPIWSAAALGDSDAIRRNLSAGANPNAFGDDSTPLQIATERGHSKAVELLIRARADPNLTDSYGNGPLWTAVHEATLAVRTEDNVAIVRMLLAAGANPDHKNRYGRTPREMIHGDKVVAKLFAESHNKHP